MAKTKTKEVELHEEDVNTGASTSTLPAEPSFAVSKRTETVPVTDDPSQYAADAGASGLENVGADEQVVPFYRILQSLSPVVAEGTVPGAMPGQIMNVGTGQRYDGKEGIVFVPAVRDHNFAKFTPREQGGGFKGLYLPDDQIVNDCRARADKLFKEGKRETDSRFGKLPVGDGDELIETFYLFGHFFDIHEEVPSPRRGLIAFASSQIKVYKQIITMLNEQKYLLNGSYVPYPIWSHRLRLRTTLVKGKKGTYHAWQPSFLNDTPIASRLPADHPVYKLGRAMFQEWRSGTLEAKYNQMSQEDVASDDPSGDVDDGPQPTM